MITPCIQSMAQAANTFITFVTMILNKSFQFSFLENLTNCRGVTCNGLASFPGGVEILLAASCYGNISTSSYKPVASNASLFKKKKKGIIITKSFSEEFE